MTTGSKKISDKIKQQIMEAGNFCQSCSMPLNDPELLGTEKDGSKSTEYCKYCYQNGAFTNPDITVEQMASGIISRLEDNKAPEDIIETAVSRLHNLKRWKNKAQEQPSKFD